MWLVLDFLNVLFLCFLLGFLLACAWCCIVGVYQWAQQEKNKRARKLWRLRLIILMEDMFGRKKSICLVLFLIMLGGCANQTPVLEVVNGKMVRVLPQTVNYLAQNDPNALKDININNELIRNK